MAHNNYKAGASEVPWLTPIEQEMTTFLNN